ncbi:MAG: NUDIX domain-containing protein [Anaerolineae bacterium]|jgi:ADP-ribose pyrophosphatase YjhB (NUDIX family)|nr:NUDIX domain-containing protein [Anaerolineae bacterium]MBT3712268.1 NUDIX domain-containing protein [Anaerolineae bacterium]MBT4311735.1 NUDIX domain-containing protein [Anaerolineae bacterium]MBT4458547.1 NUDIX domain-containing protein [Anaerolineae bacterium]MBT6062430.1 NUDIX domain-containing protein [Anaerolineae bacterium]
MPKVTTIHHGERIAKEAQIRLGCSAIILDESKNKVLLTERADNKEWCLPSGGVDSGETVEETCIREVYEETGLNVRVTRLVGVYSDPHRMVEYPDGNKAHIIAMSFEAEIIGGELGISDETTDFGYFTLNEMDDLDMLLNHKERIADALENSKKAIIK